MKLIQAAPLAFLWILFASNFSGCATAPRTTPEPFDLESLLPQTTLTPDQWALEKLNKLSQQQHTPTIAIPSSLQVTDKNSEKIIKLNVLGFLYQADYSKQDNAEAITVSKLFLKEYAKTLARAQNEYHVSKEAIAALIWVETKFGKRTGTYHLLNVFYQLLKADHPHFIRSSHLALLQKRPDADAATQKKCVDRSASKAKWALEQFEALQKMRNPQKIKSSYAGAFGIAQFIPSSYLKYAVSATPPKAPDLYKMQDAILSVASFLHQSGWLNEDPVSQAKALFEYNRSKDYGAIILQIAGKLR